MGVLPCNRDECENVMCDRYSHKYGYICYECFEELINTDLNIKIFMETPKGHDTNIKYKERRKYLNEEFELR